MGRKWKARIVKIEMKSHNARAFQLEKRKIFPRVERKSIKAENAHICEMKGLIQ